MFDYIKTVDFFEPRRQLYKRHRIPMCPLWLSKNPDDLIENYSFWPEYFLLGRPALGCLLQANELLFDRSQRHECPANFLYTFDEYYMKNTEKLSDIAYALFELKGTTGSDPQVQHFIDVITDENIRLFREPLPQSLTEGRAVFFTTLIVHRKSIPGGYLQDQFYPLLIADKLKADAVIMPKWYWKE